MRFHIARATADDWDELVGLRLAAEGWLRARGIEQWQDTAAGLEQMTRLLDAGEMFLLLDGLVMAGCFGITASHGPKWDDPDRNRFRYLRKAIVLPGYKGQGAGERAVQHALGHALAGSHLGVRLESQTGNQGLREHWERLGFSCLRTIPDCPSGVLMERRLPVLT